MTIANRKVRQNIDFSSVALYRIAANDLNFGDNIFRQGLPLKEIIHR